MNKAVLFDLDGTLLDTVHDIADKVNQTLTHFGYPTLTVTQIMQRIGNGSKMLIKNSIGVPVSEEHFNIVLGWFLKLYAGEPDAKTKPFDGILQVLQILKERGYKLAIVTNKPQPATDKICRELLSFVGFDKIIGQSGTVKCKPDKTATLNLLNELNVQPENAYFVGDGETDVLTAINANINGIAVLWGYRTKEQLSDAGARVFANKPSDLLSLIS